MLADGESLVLAMRILEHARGPGRDGEGLAMPLEGLEGLQLAQPFTRHAVVGDAHFAPADLLAGIVAHEAAEGPGHELTAQAMAEHRQVLAYGFTHELEHRRDPRQVIVHAHRAAHEYQTGKKSRITRHCGAF